MAERTNGQATGRHAVGGATAGDRPASRARRIASGGIHSPEAAFRLVNGLAADILDGAVEARDSNAVCRAVGASIQVARNADLLDDMHQRASMEAKERQAQAAEEERAARVAALKAELASLEG